MSVTLANTPVLETDRLILRAPEAQDWEPCAAFLSHDRAQYVGGPLTRDKAWRSMGHIAGHWVLRGYGLFVITDKATGAALGVAGPYFPEGWAEHELGWSLWPAHAEGRGIAFEAVTAARAYAFTTLRWTTAVSYIDPNNTRSIALAERLGARLDPDAALPGRPEWLGTLVYRHDPSEAQS
ncbi:MAG: GNAT family N-acetyltransferase [Marinibacterium sp.]